MRRKAFTKTIAFVLSAAMVFSGGTFTAKASSSPTDSVTLQEDVEDLADGAEDFPSISTLMDSAKEIHVGETLTLDEVDSTKKYEYPDSTGNGPMSFSVRGGTLIKVTLDVGKGVKFDDLTASGDVGNIYVYRNAIEQYCQDIWYYGNGVIYNPYSQPETCYLWLPEEVSSIHCSEVQVTTYEDGFSEAVALNAGDSLEQEPMIDACTMEFGYISGYSDAKAYPAAIYSVHVSAGEMYKFTSSKYSDDIIVVYRKDSPTDIYRSGYQSITLSENSDADFYVIVYMNHPYVSGKLESTISLDKIPFVSEFFDDAYVLQKGEQTVNFDTLERIYTCVKYPGYTSEKSGYLFEIPDGRYELQLGGYVTVLDENGMVVESVKLEDGVSPPRRIISKGKYIIIEAVNGNITINLEDTEYYGIEDLYAGDLDANIVSLSQGETITCEEDDPTVLLAADYYGIEAVREVHVYRVDTYAAVGGNRSRFFVDFITDDISAAFQDCFILGKEEMGYPDRYYKLEMRPAQWYDDWARSSAVYMSESSLEENRYRYIIVPKDYEGKLSLRLIDPYIKNQKVESLVLNNENQYVIDIANYEDEVRPVSWQCPSEAYIKQLNYAIPYKLTVPAHSDLTLDEDSMVGVARYRFLGEDLYPIGSVKQYTNTTDEEQEIYFILHESYGTEEKHILRTSTVTDNISKQFGKALVAEEDSYETDLNATSTQDSNYAEAMLWKPSGGLLYALPGGYVYDIAAEMQKGCTLPESKFGGVNIQLYNADGSPFDTLTVSVSPTYKCTRANGIDVPEGQTVYAWVSVPTGYVNKLKHQISITRFAPEKATGIQICKEDGTVIENEIQFEDEQNTIQLAYKLLPEGAYNQFIAWSSSDSEIVRVSQNGKLERVGDGKADITVKEAYSGVETTISVSTVNENKVATAEDELVVYSWNSEFGLAVADFKEANPDAKVRYVNLGLGGGSSEYLDMVEAFAQNPDNSAIVVAFDEGIVDTQLSKDIYVPLKDIGFDTASYKNGSYPFAYAEGTANGELKAVTNMATVGDFTYNAAIAKEVLGTDDPVEVQKLINTPEKFLAVAEQMKQAGYYMTSGSAEWEGYSKGSEDCVALSDALVANGYDAKHAMWTDEWYADLRSGEVFGFFGATWFYWVLQDASSMYNVCEGPVDVPYGGTYYAVANIDKNETASRTAKELLEYVCSNKETAYNYGKTMGFPNNRVAVEQLIADGKCADINFNGKQNPYPVWHRVANNIGTKREILVESVSVSAVDANADLTALQADFTVKLQAEVSPADADDKSIAWVSSDNAIATVDKYGTVTGKKPGTVKIKAKVLDGSDVSDEIEITVVPNEGDDWTKFCTPGEKYYYYVLNLGKGNKVDLIASLEDKGFNIDCFDKRSLDDGENKNASIEYKYEDAENEEKVTSAILTVTSAGDNDVVTYKYTANNHTFDMAFVPVKPEDTTVKVVESVTENDVKHEITGAKEATETVVEKLVVEKTGNDDDEEGGDGGKQVTGKIVETEIAITEQDDANSKIALVETKDLDEGVQDAAISVEQETISDVAMDKALDVVAQKNEEYSQDGKSNASISKIDTTFSDDAKTEISTAIFDKLKEINDKTEITLEIAKVDGSGNPEYKWEFKGKDVDTGAMQESKFDAKLEVKENDDAYADKDTLDKLVADPNQTTVVDFSHDGKLPGIATVTISVGGKYTKGVKLYFYYFNKDVGKLAETQEVNVDLGGFIKVNIKHCCDYVISDKKEKILLEGASLTLPEDNKVVVNTGKTMNAIPIELVPEDATNYDDYEVVWSSSDEEIVAVDKETGMLTAKKQGGATVKVSLYDSDSKIFWEKSFDVTVENLAVSEVALGDDKVSLEIGQTKKLNVTVTPEDATDKSVSWSSSNEKTATVSEDGTVTAVAAGTATITATAKDGSGKTASCEVTVKEKAQVDPKPVDPKPEEPQPEITPNVDVIYHTHIQTYGDKKGDSKNGQMSGTSGESKRLENIKIKVEGNKNLGIQYTTHCQTYGWLPWSTNWEANGTSGESKRLEAIKIQLTGADKDKYDVYYRVHAQTYGWLGWAKNGEPSGTAGYGKRLEGIQIVVLKKGEAAPTLDFAGVTASKGKYDSRAYVAKTAGTITIPGSATEPNVTYRTHVQKYGWQAWKTNGQMSGTSGEAKRLEGINIKLSNCPYEGGIVYTTHVQTFGWQGNENDPTTWKKNGEMSGTSGKAKRLEAIRIQLTGEMAEHYDVYYRVHAQSYGWLGWAKNGEASGTAGLAKRLEGIQIVLVPKGGAAPANNYGNIVSKRPEAYIKK